MQPLAVFTPPGVQVRRSRELIQDSRTLLASAKKRLQRTHQGLTRQRYQPIVCAWCQQLIRWKRCEQAVWGQVSHSICFDCFAFMFPELGPRPAMPYGPRRGPTLLPRRGHREPC